MADNPDQATQQTDAEGKPLSKKAVKKQQKEVEKAKRKAETAAKLDAESEARKADDPSSGCYGDLPLIQSKEKTGRVWTQIRELDASKVGQTFLVRARVHNRRGAGKLCFLVLRQQYHTVQAVVSVSDTVSKQMVRYTSDLYLESVVDVTGVISAAPEKITGCSQQDVEIQVTKIFCVSKAIPQLPLQIEDAMKPEGAEGRANQDTRLDNRIIDLRTTTNQAIFRVQAAICRLFRAHLTAKGFVEIHSPKIISGL